MKKDIPQKKVEDLAIAVIPRDGDLWDVYVINLKDEPIKNVLINSKGYGSINNEAVQTTVLRHFFPSIGPLQLYKICLLYTSPSPRDLSTSRMPSSA